MSVSSSFSTNGGSPNKHEMVGSIHIYSNGYGYGIRMPTSRNVPTLPACVPKMRYPPESGRFLEGTMSTQVIKNDDQAKRRNVDAMSKQTSGEYGRWYTDPNSDAVKLGFGRIPQEEFKPRVKQPIVYSSHESNHRFASARLGTPMNLTYNSSALYNTNSTRDPLASARLNSTSGSARLNDTWNSTATSTSSAAAQNSGRVNKTQYFETLKSLDKQFDRQSRRDLFAATLPERSEKEQVYVVASSHNAAQSSKVWSDKLRAV